MGHVSFNLTAWLFGRHTQANRQGLQWRRLQSQRADARSLSRSVQSSCKASSTNASNKRNLYCPSLLLFVTVQTQQGQDRVWSEIKTFAIFVAFIHNLCYKPASCQLLINEYSIPSHIFVTVVFSHFSFLPCPERVIIGLCYFVCLPIFRPPDVSERP